MEVQASPISPITDDIFIKDLGYQQGGYGAAQQPGNILLVIYLSVLTMAFIDTQGQGYNPSGGSYGGGFGGYGMPLELLPSLDERTLIPCRLFRQHRLLKSSERNTVGFFPKPTLTCKLTSYFSPSEQL